MHDLDTIDVLVVGGGPAGLAAALWLGRLRFRTVVADRREPRNRWVEESYGYLGFDGQPPDALLQAGRADLARYPEVALAPGVREIHRDDNGFVATLDDRMVRSSAVVFATGVADVVPPLEGLREHYGTGVFVCPLCDGYEVRGQRIAVLGAGGTAGAFAEELLRWAASVTIVPMGDEVPADELPTSVRLMTSAAAAVLSDGDAISGISLGDGSTVECDTIFLQSDTIAVTDLAAVLGCARDDQGLLIVDGDGRTTVPGVYAAGDCTPGPQLVQLAAAEGTRAGLHCAQQLMTTR